MIRVGMVVFRPEPSIFYTALEQASIVGDDVVVIYGRFKYFNMPYEKCLAMPERDNIKFIEADHKNTQIEQRDLYLEGLDSNDILLMWDSDMVLMNSPENVRKYLLSLDEKWDSMLVEWLKPDGDLEQTSICVFRYRRGWKHKHPNMLGDLDGNMICSPYNVIRSEAEMVYFHMRNQSRLYRTNQRMYWDRVLKVKI